MSDESHRQAGLSASTGLSAGEGTAPPGSPALQQAFDRDSLYTLRAAVAAHAAAAGLSPQRIFDVVATAHELAANSVVHGPGHGWLCLWASDGLLYCQVTDGGAKEMAAGETMAETVWQAEHGHGLWVAGQVADKVSIDRGDSGTTVTACFAVVGRSVRP
jgi:anti-sigma regulatory factor (Ser/Thr protein kinase)